MLIFDEYCFSRFWPKLKTGVKRNFEALKEADFKRKWPILRRKIPKNALYPITFSRYILVKTVF